VRPGAAPAHGYAPGVIDRERPRAGRALLLGAAALALVALVALAAGGYRLGGSTSSQPTPYALDTIVTIGLSLFFIGGAVALGMMVWAGVEVRRVPELQANRRRRNVTGAFLTLVAAALLLLVSNRLHLRPHFVRPHTDTTPIAARKVPESGKGAHKQSARREPQFRLVPFLFVIGAAVAAAGALVASERSRRRRLPQPQLSVEELSVVLSETLEHLRAETDPRRAVIAAYARMERDLHAFGVARQRSEAPHEYLGRVLAEVTGGARAARRLTALFERARFSPHEVDASMKQAAIEAVEELQAAIAAADAARAA
jgi:hypothetical protein